MMRELRGNFAALRPSLAYYLTESLERWTSITDTTWHDWWTGPLVRAGLKLTPEPEA